MTSTVEATLAPWVRHFKSKANLPVLLRLGDVGNGSGIALPLGDFERPKVEIVVKRASAVPLLVSPSLETLGEAYVEGKIDVQGKVADLLEVAHRMAEAGAGTKGRFTRAVHSLRHSKKGDQDAIQYHYDLSNEFYQTWLDPAMVYSCAYFENGDETLEQAQQKKLDHILTKLRLSPGQSLLDIGCGGGALVIHAAQKYGADYITRVMLTQEWYRDNMPRYKAAFEDAEITLPRDEGILTDHRAVQNINGVPKVPDNGHTTDKKDGGQRHGDSAISGALAWFASRNPASPIEYMSSGQPRGQDAQGFMHA